MSNNSPVRKYKLGKGGVYIRTENGQAVVYKAGDPILCDDVQAASSALKGRLQPWADDDTPARATEFIDADTSKDVANKAANVPETAFAEPTRDALTTPSADWTFIHQMPAADVIMRIDAMDDRDALNALADTEKVAKSPVGGRRSVLNAVAKRKRQLALANAREAKAAKKAQAASADTSNE